MSLLRIVSSGLILLLGAPGVTQEKLLERSFAAGQTHRYLVHLGVRCELEGPRPDTPGMKASPEPFLRFAEVRLSWTTTRRVLNVGSDGTAEIEETLEGFAPAEESASDADEETGKLRLALRDSLARWAGAPRLTLRFRETPRGHLLGLPRAGAGEGKAGGAPLLDDAPPVLSLWLLFALRPTVTLPDRPYRPNDRWQEPRVVEIPPWTNVTGSETGEWLEGPLPMLSIVRLDILHLVQQIAGTVPPLEGLRAPGTGRFYAESLTTLVGAGAGQGTTVQAERSARREVTYVLEPAPGQREPPRFRASVSVRVQINDVDWPWK